MHKLESEAERAKVPLEHMTLKRRNSVGTMLSPFPYPIYATIAQHVI